MELKFHTEWSCSQHYVHANSEKLKILSQAKITKIFVQLFIPQELIGNLRWRQTHTQQYITRIGGDRGMGGGGGG